MYTSAPCEELVVDKVSYNDEGPVLAIAGARE